MKCPTCGSSIPDNSESCPICYATINKNIDLVSEDNNNSYNSNSSSVSEINHIQKAEQNQPSSQIPDSGDNKTQTESQPVQQSYESVNKPQYYVNPTSYQSGSVNVNSELSGDNNINNIKEGSKDGYAVSSFIISITSLVLCCGFGIGSVVGIILGIIGLKAPTKKSFAVAGIVIGIIAVFICIIAFIFNIISILNSPKYYNYLRDYMNICANNGFIL